MKYDPLIEKLLLETSSQKAFSGLERARKMAKALDNPEIAYKTVHVAGSNGKGSTATKIAASLQKAGFCTALYTSPHLFSFFDRMQINGRSIEEKRAVTILRRLYATQEKEQIFPSFFELTTFLALQWFCEEKVAIAVIETGLGGALDATNVIDPLVSVITSISLEHQDRLGNSLEEIARQKAGIIKPGVPVVLGPKASSFLAIQEKAQECKSPVIKVPFVTGWYDDENKQIAKSALKVLEKDFPGAIKCQDLDIRPPCRFELYHNVILDVAHNMEGLTFLYEALSLHFPGKKIRTVLGLCRDKNLEHCVQFVQEKSSGLHLVQANISKAASVKELAEKASSFCFQENSVYSGVQNAKSLADEKGELLVVTGSFYLMEEAKKALFKTC